VDDPIVSNRHCLLFTENRGGDAVAILEDLSSNGTFVNEAIVGRNQRRELHGHDEIAVLDKARFIFRYPRSRTTSAFLQQYTLLEKLGKGHFAEVFLCVEKSTGQRYAVKVFSKNPSVEERSKTEGLHLEIAVLMGVSHPNVLCLKDTFNERNAVYLVLELAPEGELFNFIVMKQKLSEDECRKLFLQLFQGIKYLVSALHKYPTPEGVVAYCLHSMIEDLFTVTSSQRTSCSSTRSFTSSWPTLAWLRSLARNPSPRPYAARRATSPQRSSLKPGIASTQRLSISGRSVLSCTSASAGSPRSVTSSIRETARSTCRSRSGPGNLTIRLHTGTLSATLPVSSHPAFSHFVCSKLTSDSVDLIDSMLVVPPEKRFTVDQCLAHPWLTAKIPGVNDSTDGLVGAVAGLEMGRRGVVRERTLLSSINTVQITNRVPQGDDQNPIKIFSKNPKSAKAARGKEAAPADQRKPEEFMELGGKGDQALFGTDGDSNYVKEDIAQTKDAGKDKDKGKEKEKDKAKGKGKHKPNGR
jgi:serine/threonine-protein kinase Chk2